MQPPRGQTLVRMSTRAEREAADYTLGTPHSRASVTTAEVLAIPSGWEGRFVEFHSDAGSGSAVAIAVRFGTSASMTAPVIATHSGGTPPALTADAAVPHIMLQVQERRRVRLDPSWTHFAHIASATTGRLRFALASGPGV